MLQEIVDRVEHVDFDGVGSHKVLERKVPFLQVEGLNPKPSGLGFRV